MMQQLVKINRIIKNGTFYRVELKRKTFATSYINTFLISIQKKNF